MATLYEQGMEIIRACRKVGPMGLTQDRLNRTMADKFGCDPVVTEAPCLLARFARWQTATSQRGCDMLNDLVWDGWASGNSYYWFWWGMAQGMYCFDANEV